ncbi:SH3 domain-containing protein [Mangrovicoccus sp. HB161399]|uniref:SH3 domain-containing protein n=1 Tax=Mangrovicoccus sp. HB161399 TaxID=2720392 RepID=UPI0015526B23|nr:SH3 domain-containing protein [Mangrovicoccus sp. HB161399]
MAIRLTAILLLVIFAVMQFGGRDLDGSPFAEIPSDDPSTVILAVAPLDEPLQAAPRPAAAADGPAGTPVAAAIAAVASSIPGAEPAVAATAPAGTGTGVSIAEPDGQTALDMAVIDAAVVGKDFSAVPSRTLQPGVSPSSVASLDTFKKRQIAAAGANSSDMAQVTGSNVNLRSGPSTGNAVVGQAREGEHVEWISEPAPGWALIRHPRYDGDMYMSSNYLQRISD